MSTWGSPWGAASFWGSGSVGPGPAFVCELVEERTLVQMDDAPGNRNFRDFLCILTEGFGSYLDVLDDIEEAFDLSTAVGVQLDVIGRIVRLPRGGYSDARYRTLLEIQIDLILSANRDDGFWTGTTENVIGICRKFIGPTVDPVVLVNLPPYDFLLTVPTIATSDIPLLFRFLRTAIYAGVLGQLIIPLGADSLWNSDAVAVTGGGTWGSDAVAVAGSATWGTVLTIGTGP